MVYQFYWPIKGWGLQYNKERDDSLDYQGGQYKLYSNWLIIGPFQAHWYS